MLTTFAISLLCLALIVAVFLAIRRGIAKRRLLEAQLERFFSLSLDFLCISSADGYFKRVSPAVTDILGWSAEEFLAMPYLRLVHPEDRAATLVEVQKQMVANEKVLQFENRYRHKDGSWRTLSWRSIPQPDGLMYATARDVTQVAQAAKMLRETNEQLEQRVTQRTTELAEVSESLRHNERRDITQRKENETRLQGQVLRLGLLSQITRAIGERQDTRSILQVVVRTLEEQLPADFICICLHDPGSNALTVTSVGLNSERLAIDLAMTEQARVAVEQSGFSRCVRGELIHEADISNIPYAFPQRLSRAGMHSLIAAPLRVKSDFFGVLVAARRTVNSFSSDDCNFLGQLSEHVALAAHQAQLHSSLQKAYDDLHRTQQAVLQQERLRALGEMASGIAHDINNAISPMSLYTESLLEREPNLSPRARDYLETIHRSIGDIARTVARMREFYRQREPQMILLPVSINQLARQVADLTRARWSDMAQRRGIAIDLHLDLTESLPLVMGAESELREALVNLIFNAVDAMPQGGRLSVHTAMAGEDAVNTAAGSGPARVFIEVHDNGIGMDDDTKRRCLEPFFTTKGERGTGLGLAMVYGIVQRHNAKLDIESVAGKGTLVRISFAVPTSMPVETAPASPAAIPSARRILLIDDDPILLRSLQITLEGDGHTVAACHGGQFGVDSFRAAHECGQKFAAVITDLGMPFVDGSKVAAAVKALNPSMPVILFTGWGERMLIEGDIPPHVDKVLGKPAKLSELRAALSSFDPVTAKD